MELPIVDIAGNLVDKLPPIIGKYVDNRGYRSFTTYNGSIAEIQCFFW